MKNFFLNLGILAGFVIVFGAAVYSISIFWGSSVQENAGQDLSGFFEINDGDLDKLPQFVVMEEIIVKQYFPLDFVESQKYKTLVFFDYGYDFTNDFFDILTDEGYLIYRFEVEVPNAEKLNRIIVDIKKNTYVEDLTLVSFELGSLYASEVLDDVDSWIDVDGSFSLESALELCNLYKDNIECLDDEFLDIDVTTNLSVFEGDYYRIVFASDLKYVKEFFDKVNDKLWLNGFEFESLDDLENGFEYTNFETNQQRDTELIKLIKEITA